MVKISVKNVARLAATAGLGMSLAFSVAPAVALADDTSGEVVVPAEAAAIRNEDGVATVNGVAYETLVDAISAVPANVQTTVTLTDNIVMNTSGIVEIPAGDNIILDLAGHSITVNEGFSGRPIINRGVLQITGNGTIDSSKSTGGFGAVYNYGTLTILNGTFGGNVAASGSCIRNTGSASVLTVEDGTFQGATCMIYNEGVATLNGGTYKGESCSSCNRNAWAYTIQNHSPSDSDAMPAMVINGGTYGGVQGVISSSYGNLTVNDGTFTAHACESGHQPFYALYVAGEDGQASAEINGGIFENEGSRPVAYVANDNKGGDGGINAEAFVRFNGGKYIASTGGDAVHVENLGSLEIHGGEYHGTISSKSKTSFIMGGSFTIKPDESYLASGMTYDDVSDKVALDTSKTFVAYALNGAGQVIGAFTSLEDAVAGAPAGGTVQLLSDVTPTSTITIDRAITLTAAKGVEVTALANGQHTFALSNGAALDGLDITIGDVSGVTNIVNMVDGTSVKNCTFTGSFDLASNDQQVCRAIEGSSGELTIEGNTFTNLRQPGYINACTGSIANNTIEGTRGWVICGDSNMKIEGNIFENNAVDVAIIDANAGDQDFTNNYAKKADDISSSNNGAYVQNQLGKVEAKNGVIVVGKSVDGDYTFDAALAEAEGGSTILLEDDIETDSFNVDKDVTIDGNGFTITNNDSAKGGTFVTVGVPGVTIKDVTLDAKDATHGVQFYKSTKGMLDGVTINGGTGTSVLVNGSTVTIKDCKLNPATGAYANVEYGMGGGVTTIPEITFEGTLELGSAQHGIWADQDTTKRMKGELGASATDQDVQKKLAESVTNNTKTDVKIDAVLSDGGNASVEVPGEKPVTPPIETGHAVTVEQAEGGKVAVTPAKADKGETVTITATPDAGQEVRTVEVLDAAGKAVAVKAGSKANTWTFTMPDGAVKVSVTFGCDGGELCPSNDFDDVDQDAWYHDVLDWAVEEGLLSGFADGTMGPEATLSRGQLATVLWRRAGEPAATTGHAFSDCDPEAFYADAVAWAAEKGVIKGYGDGTVFGPNDPVTREQFATILWRLAGEPEAKGDLGAYPDAEDATAYAVDALEWAIEEGVLSGFGTGELAPTGMLSRAMLAAMLYRIDA